MFERETILNEFQLGYAQQIIADIPADQITKRFGHGHPPIWVLGHLGLCAELGEMLLGNPVAHADWMPIFGPGSSDEVENPSQYSKDELAKMIFDGYPRLCQSLQSASDEALSKPHGVDLLDGTPINTVGELQSHLLTTHIAFHLAQLSDWRRAAGHGPLF